VAIITTEAIVLRTKGFRETSLIATLFTDNSGKIQGLAKGIRSKEARYQSRLQPLTLDRIVFYERKKSDLHTITQCELIDSFTALHHDLIKMAYASVCMELVEQTTQPHDRNRELFKLLLETLRQLCIQKDPDTTCLMFQVRALSLLGFMPQLKFCSSCGEEISEALNFSPSAGGLICKGCLKNGIEAVEISKGAVTSMLHIGRRKWEGIRRFRLTKKIAEELREPVTEFVKAQTQAELKSLDFIEKIKNG